MQRTELYLEEEQLHALERLAEAERQSVSDLLRRAVDSYLSQHSTDDGTWRARLDQLATRYQSRIPTEITPAEIEDDITVARLGVTQAHRATRSR